MPSNRSGPGADGPIVQINSDHSMGYDIVCDPDFIFISSAFFLFYRDRDRGETAPNSKISR